MSIKLEESGSNGVFPWVDSLVSGDIPAIPATPEADRSLPTSAASDGGNMVVSSVTGDRAGLYGGSGEIAVCDTERLIAFLHSDPAKARAWSSVLDAGDVDAYVRSLTAVVLRVDTLVTNHGFENGAATEYPAVLQAGTAVLVDKSGSPRVRCASGSPLTPPTTPTNTNSTSVQFDGPRWPRFAPQTVFAVAPAPQQVTVFTVVDLRTGKLIEKLAGFVAKAAPTTTTEAPPPPLEAAPIPAPAPEPEKVVPTTPAPAPTTQAPPPTTQPLPRPPIVIETQPPVAECDPLYDEYECQGPPVDEPAPTTPPPPSNGFGNPILL
ncbi:DUF6777 domain-containing protein [Smaragdicoccus niigatensis]|uniref:DUF6777 domain-containing protein n=1 Tax=Smaragdicoccus niigatensis TaxID=359359 RepID=UPI0012DBD0D5|nr:DUF6777 domain-containing protein [Smaragdicoccus niigatensis]